MQVTAAESYQYVEKGCVLTGKKKGNYAAEAWY